MVSGVSDRHFNATQTSNMTCALSHKCKCSPFVCHTAAKIAEGEKDEEDGGRAIRGQAATKERDKSSYRKADQELRNW